MTQQFSFKSMPCKYMSSVILLMLIKYTHALDSQNYSINFILKYQTLKIDCYNTQMGGSIHPLKIWKKPEKTQLTHKLNSTTTVAFLHYKTRKSRKSKLQNSWESQLQLSFSTSKLNYDSWVSQLPNSTFLNFWVESQLY